VAPALALGAPLPDRHHGVARRWRDGDLQVLDAETRLFDSQLQLAALKRDEQVAVLQLYL